MRRIPNFWSLDQYQPMASIPPGPGTLGFFLEGLIIFSKINVDQSTNIKRLRSSLLGDFLISDVRGSATLLNSHMSLWG